MANKKYQSLTKEQIETMQSQGCSAQDWGKVKVSNDFDATRILNVRFDGKVDIGNLSGKIKNAKGLEKPCGIYNAVIINCTIGNNVFISGIAVHIANYEIADNVCIENVATLQTNPGATFANGVEIDVLNEAGGREVVLFDELNVQFAYIMCLHRYRPGLIKKLKSMATDYAASVKSDSGKIAEGAKICSVTEIIDVKVGAYAIVNGALSLINGTILSSKEAPTTIGVGVIADDFIIAESSTVNGGAILAKVFIGQGCQVGKQYSAENSLFFANSEAFHGEACSVFGGPYTVTHHKSSLLIAGLFSFYNAGSGTNQSNHMYKLGPVHEGKLQRGTKTGSFSYMMWPCIAGPFSVILGKHTGTFDTRDYPFSHLEAKSNGKCNMVPGLHLTTVGTVRDGAKWPNRDRRKGSIKRDIISFDVFSPYTVGKMIKAADKLKQLQQETDKAAEEVSVGGALVRRPILRTGQKYYRKGIEIYLLEKIVEKAEKALKDGVKKISDLFKSQSTAVYSEKWVDIGGQLMAEKRITDFEDAIEAGKVNTVENFMAEMLKIDKNYKNDEWLWVKNAYKQVFDVELDKVTTDDIIKIADTFKETKSKFLTLVISDAEKEFDELSHSGFGQDGKNEDIEKDFSQVRGIYDDNKFVKEMKSNIEQLQERTEQLKKEISKL